MKIYSINTVPGIEKICYDEIKKLEKIDPIVIKENKGKLIIKTKSKDFWKKVNFFSRSAERIVDVIKYETLKKTTLSEIYKICLETPWEEYLDPKKTFGVKTNRVGNHKFTSMNISAIIGKAIIDRLKIKTGLRIPVNLNSPEQIIRCDLIENEITIGIDKTGLEGLQKRGYRIYNHPAHLNACIAYALTKLSEFKKGKVLIDPMCGSGTIPIEATMYIQKIPPGVYNEIKYIKFWKRFYSKQGEIIGIEKFKKHILGAKENIKNAKLEKYITLINQDCLKFLKETSLNYDCLVFNPPYGVRIGKKSLIKKMYEELFEIIKKEKDITVCLITTEKKLMDNIIKKHNFWLEKKLFVKYGGLDTYIYKFKI